MTHRVSILKLEYTILRKRTIHASGERRWLARAGSHCSTSSWRNAAMTGKVSGDVLDVFPGWASDTVAVHTALREADKRLASSHRLAFSESFAGEVGLTRAHAYHYA